MQILGFCLALFLLAGCHTVQSSHCAGGGPRCSSEEAPVWTTKDDGFCRVFRNGCLLLTQNCDLERQNETQYREITQTKCQELCRDTMCLALYSPVCGEYNGEYKTFSNDCQMGIHICTTGQTYSLYKGEACPGSQ